LGQAQDGAHAVGEILVGAFHDAFEQRHGLGGVAARQQEEAELRGGEVVGFGQGGELAEFLLGLGLAVHAQQEIGEIAAQVEVFGVELQGALELGDVGIAGGQQFAGGLGGARFASAGGGQQGGIGFFGAVQSLQDAAEIHQHGAAFGDQAPGFLVMFGGEFQFVALFGEGGQLEVGAEIVGAELDGFGPAGDAFGQGAVDILKGALGGGAGFGVAGWRTRSKTRRAWACCLVSLQRNAYSRATWKSLGSSSMASRNWSRAAVFSPILR
jgi:hypothetical protein